MVMMVMPMAIVLVVVMVLASPQRQMPNESSWPEAQ